MALSFFTVTDALYEVVETNTTDANGLNTPTVVPFSGTATFTPSVREIDGDATILLDPIEGRFNVDMDSGTYTTTGTGDTTFAEVADIIGGVGMTAAVLEAANSGVTEPIAASTTLNTPSVQDGALRALNGTLGVALVDNNDLGLPVGELTYVVTYTNVVADGTNERMVTSFRFAAPGDGSSVNLNTVSRLPL